MRSFFVQFLEQSFGVEVGGEGILIKRNSRGKGFEGVLGGEDF